MKVSDSRMSSLSHILQGLGKEPPVVSKDAIDPVEAVPSPSDHLGTGRQMLPSNQVS